MQSTPRPRINPWDHPPRIYKRRHTMNGRSSANICSKTRIYNSIQAVMVVYTQCAPPIMRFIRFIFRPCILLAGPRKFELCVLYEGSTENFKTFIFFSGDYLRDKYDGATEVRVNRRGRLQLKDPHITIPTAYDLVYLEDSPDYCIKNDVTGSLGTQGRPCNRTSPDIDGCNILCCGRGYNTINTVVKERCQCKFKWCCEVQCKTCVKSLDAHTCK